MPNKLIITLSVIIIFSSIFSGCDRSHKKLIVYSGKGLEKVMEQIIYAFESKYGVEVESIFAGSETLLTTISMTKKGDVFIPGSLDIIKTAGNLVKDHKYVALHVPAFVVRGDNPKELYSIEDLTKPGVKIAIGNKKMCAIGRISDEIIHGFSNKEQFFNNISITGSTVNELLELVVNKDVDAALVWKEMMLWPEAKDLRVIDIPPDMNKPKKVHVAVLETTSDVKTATLFTEFVATEGKVLFLKHGFGE